jgi:carbonic anhydrase
VEESPDRQTFTRGTLLAAGGLGAAALLAEPFSALAQPSSPPAAQAISPAGALALLAAGNRRYVAGRALHPNQTVRRRVSLRPGQHPFATVVSCIDSRVPPDIVFDRGLGDIVEVRTGAQVLDNGIVLGSTEFSVDHLFTPVLLVLGHQRCGAVKSAIEAFEKGGHAPGAIGSVVAALRPAYLKAKQQRGDLVDNMVRAQTTLAVARLKQSPVVSELVAHGKLVVRGGHYSLDTGAVTLIA